MRAIMSPIGSFTMGPSSPARLHKAGNEAFGAKLAQRDAAEPMLAVIGARPPGHLAAIADAGCGGIARQLGELQGRREALLHRQFLVLHDCLELLTPAGE